uniref:Uncharacterized protein n=1 Tax=Melanopsichium pennsylvanicum 4 TaxID=1398559 RepID=A0A077R2B8_9BASI|nr:uncharacterized protein BN887_03429 [Melanopsichium pennsylvanicum 4]
MRDTSAHGSGLKPSTSSGRTFFRHGLSSKTEHKKLVKYFKEHPNRWASLKHQVDGSKGVHSVGRTGGKGEGGAGSLASTESSAGGRSANPGGISGSETSDGAGAGADKVGKAKRDNVDQYDVSNDSKSSTSI